MVESLVLSIRCFGGSLCAAPITVNVVGRTPDSFERALKELDVSMRLVEPVGGGSGLANKLRMLELDRELDFDVLVALDCDVVVVDDFADRVSSESIGVKPVDYDRFTARDWRKLYEMAGLVRPDVRLRATSTGKTIPPYYNSGVITVPHALCSILLERWQESYARLVEQLRKDPDVIPRHLHWFAEQASLALAIQGAQLPCTPLPVGLNFPTHVPVHSSALADEAPPSILHYHGAVDSSGFLLRPRSETAVARAEEFNRVRAERFSLPYAGIQDRSSEQRIRATLRRPRNAWSRRHRIRSWMRSLRGGPPSAAEGTQ
jgi:hypothetical protein